MVTDQNLHLRMQALMGIQEDIQNKNSYRPHVRSEAGYDITQTTVVIKTTAESGMPGTLVFLRIFVGHWVLRVQFSYRVFCSHCLQVS